MQIKLFIAYKFTEIALKYTKTTESKKTSKTRPKFDIRMKQKNITSSLMLLDNCYAFVLLL